MHRVRWDAWSPGDLVPAGFACSAATLLPKLVLGNHPVPTAVSLGELIKLSARLRSKPSQLCSFAENFGGAGPPKTDWGGWVRGVRQGTARGSLEAASDRGGHWCLHRIPGAASWLSPKRVSVFPLILSSLFPLPSFQQIPTSLNPQIFFCHIINRVTFCCLQPNYPKNDQRQLGSSATQPLSCPSKLR